MITSAQTHAAGTVAASTSGCFLGSRHPYLPVCAGVARARGAGACEWLALQRWPWSGKQCSPPQGRRPAPAAALAGRGRASRHATPPCALAAPATRAMKPHLTACFGASRPPSVVPTLPAPTMPTRMPAAATNSASEARPLTLTQPLRTHPGGTRALRAAEDRHLLLRWVASLMLYTNDTGGSLHACPCRLNACCDGDHGRSVAVLFWLTIILSPPYTAHTSNVVACATPCTGTRAYATHARTESSTHARTCTRMQLQQQALQHALSWAPQPLG